MIKEDRDSRCSACGACMSACPKNCITIKKDQEGFYYPYIDKRNCIQCNKCSMFCQIDSKYESVLINGSFYSAYSLNTSIREGGSSGGMFETLANLILEKGGVVYGAAFDDDFAILRHKSTDDVTLEQLKKSKYVESFMGDTISKIQGDINNGKVVLFCGTPCQVKGVRNYFDKLGISQENLICIDLLCHGVPSSEAYTNYINYIEKKYGSKVTNVSFRSKKMGWQIYCMYLQFKNGKEYLKTGIEDPYYRMFFSCKNFRKSCYGCDNVKHSASDITLGDFWGTKTDLSDKGVSFVAANTYKGKKIISLINNKLIIQEVSYEKIISFYDKHNYIRAEIVDNNFEKYKFSLVRFAKGIVLKNRLGRKLVRVLRNER